jgi:hypothetical protein
LWPIVLLLAAFVETVRATAAEAVDSPSAIAQSNAKVISATLPVSRKRCSFIASMQKERPL